MTLPVGGAAVRGTARIADRYMVEQGRVKDSQGERLVAGGSI